MGKREELVKRLRRYTEGCVADRLDADFASAVQEAAEALEAINAADVRPVVLCRDCRHWDTDWTPTHARKNEHFCPNIGLTTREDWFCADGEKREEN